MLKEKETNANIDRDGFSPSTASLFLLVQSALTDLKEYSLLPKTSVAALCQYLQRIETREYGDVYRSKSGRRGDGRRGSTTLGFDTSGETDSGTQGNRRCQFEASNPFVSFPDPKLTSSPATP